MKGQSDLLDACAAYGSKDESGREFVYRFSTTTPWTDPPSSSTGWLA